MTRVTDMIKFFYEIDTDAFDILRYNSVSSDAGYWSAFSNSVIDFSFNHILPVGKVDTTDVLRRAASEFKTLNREPVACVTPFSMDYNSVDIPWLKLMHTDAWMRFSNLISDIYTNPSISVRQIDKSNLAQYIEVFSLGFSDHIYNNLEDGYKTIEQKSFDNPYKIKKMAFVNSEPAGVVSVSIKSQIAYIEAFTIIPKYRMGGEVAKCLGTDIINTCHVNGANNIFLITAAGTPLERMYKMNGFETEFYGRFYTWK